MSIVLFGSRTFGADVLAALDDDGHEIDRVISPAARRDDPEEWDRLRTEAWKRDITWIPAETFRAEQVPPCALIIAAHSHNFIGRKTRARADEAAIGYHPSLLPLHKGRDAVRWTVRDRDKVAGGSVYHLTDNVDGGPLAAQDWCFVRPDDTAQELWRRELAPMGIRLLRQTVKDLLWYGRVVMVPQDQHVGSWEPSWERPPLHRPELPEIEAAESTRHIQADPAALRR